MARSAQPVWLAGLFALGYALACPDAASAQDEGDGAQTMRAQKERFVEVTLKNGAVVRGTLLSRKDGALRIQRAADDVVVIPESIVVSVTGDEDPSISTGAVTESPRASDAPSTERTTELRGDEGAEDPGSVSAPELPEEDDGADRASPPMRELEDPLVFPARGRPTGRELTRLQRMGMFTAGVAAHQVGLWAGSSLLFAAAERESISLYVLGGIATPLAWTISTSEVVSFVGRRAMGYEERDFANRVGEAYEGAMYGILVSVPLAAAVWNATIPEFPDEDFTTRELIGLALPYTLLGSVLVSGLTTRAYKRAVLDYEKGWRAGRGAHQPDATAKSTENLRWRWRWELSPAPGGGVVRMGATF